MAIETYIDFENYWLGMQDIPAIGVKSVIVGDLEDVADFQKNAQAEIYPLLFVHVPDFESYHSGGNKNRFDSDFLVIESEPNRDRAAKRGIYNRTREIVLNIQKKMETDAENGLFEFDGVLRAEPRAATTADRCFGWFVGFQMATCGVGLDTDYR